jgi:hypothetical protein
MRSKPPGKRTSKVELSNVSPHGIWLLLAGREIFLPFKDFPWFEDASIRALSNVELPSPHHLYWPDLDVDLAVESIENPHRYPLISTSRPNKSLHRTHGASGTRLVKRNGKTKRAPAAVRR